MLPCSMIITAVIANEHLTEALRRLRKSSADATVDKRLVTNVILQFLSAPRGDSKRYQVLSVLASILSWDDTEREKAGLQRTNPTLYSAPIPGRRVSSSSKIVDLNKADETEVGTLVIPSFASTDALILTSHSRKCG